MAEEAWTKPAVPAATFESNLAPAQGTPAGSVGMPMDAVPLIDAVTAGLLASCNHFVIQQRVKVAEAMTMGCYQQANTYDVFDGDSNQKIFEIQEVSDDCSRCCCAPGHSLLLAFFRMNGNQRSDQVMTMEREGCTCKGGCCGGIKQGLGCFACYPCCQDGMRLHAGKLQNQPHEPGANPQDKLIGAAQVPPGGGGGRPIVQVMDRMGSGPSGQAGMAPFSVVQGPGCYGGFGELCCHTNFTVSKVPQTATKVEQMRQYIGHGDTVSIQKTKPKGLGAALREFVTDSDVYTIKVADRAYTPQQKANLLATMALLDFMFFERDNDMIHCKDGKLHFVFTNCYCYGCLLPCEIVLGDG